MQLCDLSVSYYEVFPGCFVFYGLLLIIIIIIIIIIYIYCELINALSAHIIHILINLNVIVCTYVEHSSIKNN